MSEVIVKGDALLTAYLFVAGDINDYPEIVVMSLKLKNSTRPPPGRHFFKKKICVLMYSEVQVLVLVRVLVPGR